MDRAEAFALVESELNHQRLKWNRQDGDWPSDPGKKFLILGEEVGEIANSVLEGDLDNVQTELAQVAAVCISWLMADWASITDENVNKAKEILYSKYAKEKGKKPDDLTPDEKMKIEDDPKFIKVKEAIGSKNPRLIYPFTKFYVIDGAPWDALVELTSKYLSANPGPKSLRLGPIENYADLPFLS